MKRAFSYVRMSRPEQIAGDSLRRQLQASRDWCKRNGYILDESLKLHDLGVSAYRGKNAEVGALRRFIDAAKAGRIPKGSVLIVENLDRLSRQDIEKGVRLLMDITDLGIIVQTLTPEQTFEAGKYDMIALIGAIFGLSMAAGESRKKGERVAAAWAAKRERITTGEKLTARCPAWLALSKDRMSFELLPEKVAIVQRIFRMAIDGIGLRSIAKRLHSERVKPIARAKIWHASYVKKIIANRAVLGEFQACLGKKDISLAKRETVGEVIKDYFPRIVSEADFYRANKAVENRQSTGGPSTKRIANLFTGLIRDARDGFSMQFIDKGKKASGPQIVSSGARLGVNGSQYVSFRYDVFEDAFLQLISELKPEDVLPHSVDSLPLKDELATMQGRLRGIVDKIGQIQDQLAGPGKLDALQPVLARLEAQQKAAQARIEEIKTVLHDSADDNLSQTQELIVALKEATGQDLIDLRLRIKARIASLVDSIWMCIHDYGRTRIAECQIFFAAESSDKEGGYRELIIRKDQRLDGFRAAVSPRQAETIEGWAYNGGKKKVKRTFHRPAIDFRKLNTKERAKLPTAAMAYFGPSICPAPFVYEDEAA